MNREEHVWREAARYLGYGRTKPDRQTAELIDTSLEELSLLAVPRSVYSICTLQMEGEEICLGPFQIRSKNLARNLAGCSRAAIFAATLGAETDRAIHRYEHIHMAKAVVMQACAAAVLEDYCDAVQEQIREELQDEAWRENETQGQNGAQGQKEAQGERNGRFLRPRFSPGYGDLAIELQRELIAFLDAPKRI